MANNIFIKAKLKQRQNIIANSTQRGPQGIPGKAATIDVGTVTTGLPGTNASVVNVGTITDAILDFTIPRGEKGETGAQGETGATGNGIVNTEKISSVGLVDTYQINYTDGGSDTFTVTNGQDGNNGISDVTINGTSVVDDNIAKILIKTVNNNSIIGNGNLDIDALPSQTGQSGKYLTTNGTTASWASVTIPTVDQTYNATSANAQSGTAVAGAIINKQDTLVSGTNIKTVNGTSLLGSGDITVGLPSQSGYTSAALTTDGTDASWNDLADISEDSIELSSFPMPGNVYDTLTIGANESTYIAPSNGYFMFTGNVNSNSGGAFTVLENVTTKLEMTGYAPTNWTARGISLPVKKGDIVKIHYQGSVSGATLLFIYALGSESEVS